MNKEIINQIKKIKGMMLSIRLQKKVNGENIAPWLLKSLKRLVARMYSGAVSVEESTKIISDMKVKSEAFIKSREADNMVNESSPVSEESNEYASEDIIGESIKEKTNE